VRTLIGAADPEPRYPSAIQGFGLSAGASSTTSTSVISYANIIVATTAAAPPQGSREPYRTTAVVGEQIRELES